MHKLVLGLFVICGFVCTNAFAQRRGIEPIGAVQILSHPNQYIENHRFARYEILVAVEETDPDSQRYLDHRLPEITSLLKSKKIPYTIRYIEPELLAEFKTQYAEVISELKESGNVPKAVAAHFEGENNAMTKLQNYWRKIYVPATNESIERGILYGTLLQAGITAATGFFLESKDALPSLEQAAQIGVVAVFGGVLGVYNETLRNFLKMPDHALTNLVKSMAISGTFAVPMKLVTHGGRIALSTIVGCAKILEHCFLSQVAKVYLSRILLFREKYGYLSSKKAFFWSQVGLYGVYLFLRICHLNDIPILSYGFYAMGPVGFLAYLGYQSHLTAVVRNSKRFYTLSDVESGRLILTEVDKSFELEFLKLHPNLNDLNPQTGQRSFSNQKFRNYYFRVTWNLFMDETKGILKSIGSLMGSGIQACGRVFSMLPSDFRTTIL